MKKLFSILVASAILMFPFATYAAVNITLREADTGSVAIGIDTETDTLESVVLPISYSEGVEITDVAKGDVPCSELSYTESENTPNTLIVICTLDSATALDGVLGNITYNSTGDTPATFEVVESDELDLGTLTLGQTVSFEQTSTESTAEDVTTTGEELPTTTGTPTTEEDLMVTTGETAETATNGNLLSSITEYLPYILIAGSVILLISIVVILLGKKDGSKQPKEKKDKKGDPTQISPVMGGEQQSERSLKDMVNNPDSAPTQTTPIPAPTPMSQNTPQTPAQPTYTSPQQSVPPISSASQEEDLQEILQRESSIPTAMGDNTPQEMPQAETPQAPQTNQGVPFSTGFSAPQQDGPENIMPEAPQPITNPAQEMSPVTSMPEMEATSPIQQPGTTQNLQENVNGQINQITGGVIPSQQPSVEAITQQQPTQQESRPQMPPITLQQNPNTDNTPEEMPPVPPTM
jgi:hypothetical protein